MRSYPFCFPKITVCLHLYHISGGCCGQKRSQNWLFQPNLDQKMGQRGYFGPWPIWGTPPSMVVRSGCIMGCIFRSMAVVRRLFTPLDRCWIYKFGNLPLLILIEIFHYIDKKLVRKFGCESPTFAPLRAKVWKLGAKVQKLGAKVSAKVSNFRTQFSDFRTKGCESRTFAPKLSHQVHLSIKKTI